MESSAWIVGVMACAMQLGACAAGDTTKPLPGEGAASSGESPASGASPEPPVADTGDGHGGSGGACATAKAEASTPPVDVIVVVDQSGSMAEEIAQVTANLNGSLADVLAASALDYRVILIASPVASGIQINPICIDPPLGGPSCGAPNAPIFFQAAQHIESSDSLYWLIDTYDSVDANKRWQDQLRFEAVKVFIEVSDDNASAISIPPLIYGLDAQGFQDALFALEPAGMFGTAALPRYVFHSIVGVDQAYPPSAPVTTQACATSPEAGMEYQKLSIATGGLRFPVCESDYSSVFEAIAQTTASSVACAIALVASAELDPEKVNVLFTPSSGASQTILQDTTAPCDAGANGWQWADEQTIVLCGEACAMLQADPGATVEIEVGCATEVALPE